MADPSFNYSYTPTVDHREANLYREEYYSATDTKIYFDNDEQTEIGYIQYEIQEQLKPVYGYNSRTFDDVVIGNRIVTGTFTVPIKNKQKQEFDASQLATYMGEKEISSNNNNDNYNIKEEENLYNTDWFGSTKRNIDAHNNSSIDSEYLTKLIAIGYDINANASTQKYENVIKKFQHDNDCTVTGILNENTKNKIDQEFNKKSAQQINLDGATGYDDQSLTRGGYKLGGNGLLLNTLTRNGKELYEVMDTNGNVYYIEGLVI